MKNRKAIIILSSAVVIAAVGFIVSPLVDWKVDSENASGDIGKTSRFSRKTATESLSNMEELILNDEAYKNSIVASYYVMQTRANLFATLVDMSNEVASDIPVYADVLEDMNKAYVTVNNVCASLARSGADINATLGGASCPDLAQNTINASLAYVALQKQNELANRFIDITDKYAAENECEDRLLFVRDQWVDYQRMTAALEENKKMADKLDDKGYLLDSEKSVSSLGSFNVLQQVNVVNFANLANNLFMATQLNAAIPVEELRSAVEANSILANTLQNSVQESLQNSVQESLQNSAPENLQNINVQESALAMSHSLANATLGIKEWPQIMQPNNLNNVTSESLSRVIALGGMERLQNATELAIVTINARPQQFDEAGLDKGNVIFSQVNTAIEQTSLGQVCKMVVW